MSSLSVYYADKWIVVGGSTGAMLGFAYGTEHPDRCIGILLRGEYTILIEYYNILACRNVAVCSGRACLQLSGP